MGKIETTCYRIGVGSVKSYIHVKETPGYSGKWVTPVDGNGLRIKRNGRKVIK